MLKVALTVILMVFLMSCVVVHDHKHHVPPGQIKKQMAPGQMKK